MRKFLTDKQHRQRSLAGQASAEARHRAETTPSIRQGSSGPPSRQAVGLFRQGQLRPDTRASRSAWDTRSTEAPLGSVNARFTFHFPEAYRSAEPLPPIRGRALLVQQLARNKAGPQDLVVNNAQAVVEAQRHPQMRAIIASTLGVVRDHQAGAIERGHERRLIPEGTPPGLVARAYKHAALMAIHKAGLGDYDFHMDDTAKAEFSSLVPFMRYASRRVFDQLNVANKGKWTPFREEFGEHYVQMKHGKPTGVERMRMRPSHEFIKIELGDLEDTALEKAFEEHKHPRGHAGRFAAAGGVIAATAGAAATIGAGEIHRQARVRGLKDIRAKLGPGKTYYRGNKVPETAPGVHYGAAYLANDKKTARLFGDIVHRYKLAPNINVHSLDSYGSRRVFLESLKANGPTKGRASMNGAWKESYRQRQRGNFADIPEIGHINLPVHFRFKEAEKRVAGRLGVKAIEAPEKHRGDAIVVFDSANVHFAGAPRGKLQGAALAGSRALKLRRALTGFLRKAHMTESAGPLLEKARLRKADQRADMHQLARVALARATLAHRTGGRGIKHVPETEHGTPPALSAASSVKRAAIEVERHFKIPRIGGAALGKRDPGDPLTSRELEERRLAARARWQKAPRAALSRALKSSLPPSGTVTTPKDAVRMMRQWGRTNRTERALYMSPDLKQVQTRGIGSAFQVAPRHNIDAVQPDYTILHNHPSATPLSSTDVNGLVIRESTKAMHGLKDADVAHVRPPKRIMAADPKGQISSMSLRMPEEEAFRHIGPVNYLLQVMANRKTMRRFARDPSAMYDSLPLLQAKQAGDQRPMLPLQHGVWKELHDRGVIDYKTTGNWGRSAERAGRNLVHLADKLTRKQAARFALSHHPDAETMTPVVVKALKRMKLFKIEGAARLEKSVDLGFALGSAPDLGNYNTNPQTQLHRAIHPRMRRHTLRLRLNTQRDLRHLLNGGVTRQERWQLGASTRIPKDPFGKSASFSAENARERMPERMAKIGGASEILRGVHLAALTDHDLHREVNRRHRIHRGVDEVIPERAHAEGLFPDAVRNASHQQVADEVQRRVHVFKSKVAAKLVNRNHYDRHILGNMARKMADVLKVAKMEKGLIGAAMQYGAKLAAPAIAGAARVGRRVGGGLLAADRGLDQGIGAVKTGLGAVRRKVFSGAGAGIMKHPRVQGVLNHPKFPGVKAEWDSNHGFYAPLKAGGAALGRAVGGDIGAKWGNRVGTAAEWGPEAYGASKIVHHFAAGGPPTPDEKQAQQTFAAGSPIERGIARLGKGFLGNLASRKLAIGAGGVAAGAAAAPAGEYLRDHPHARAAVGGALAGTTAAILTRGHARNQVRRASRAIYERSMKDQLREHLRHLGGAEASPHMQAQFSSVRRAMQRTALGPAKAARAEGYKAIRHYRKTIAGAAAAGAGLGAISRPEHVYPAG